MVMWITVKGFHMKTVYFKSRSRGGPIHSLYGELIRHPPEGYKVLTGKSSFRIQQSSSGLDKRQQLVHYVNKKLEDISFTRSIWYETKALSYACIKKAEKPNALWKSGADLVYSAQQLTFAKFPHVVDLEYANALANYGDIRIIRRIVQKALASEYCRKILPWSDWAKRTLYRSLDCSSFKEKIETTHFAVSKKDFVKKEKNSKLKLLFVGSINQFNFLNFEWKGGFEVVEAFLELSKKYDCLELVIRSWVPPEIAERCAGKPNIKIINHVLSDEALANLYACSDIFLFPSYMNLGMAILEAMSYELPVIAINLYDVSEAIQDMKTGILLSAPPKVPFYIWNGAPNHYDKKLIQKIRQSRPWMVKQIVDKVSLLIENEQLRRRIGLDAKHLVGEGEFSTKKRNEKLKRIFDEAVAAD
jgi:glycosyltransferase involved in cell wall biosynthesis